MNTETPTPRKHKRYDENFKRSAVAAVEMWLQGGKSVEMIADTPYAETIAASRSIGASLYR